MRNICIRCGHAWQPHAGKENSKVCPKCKSPYWNKSKHVKPFFDPTIHTQSHDDFKMLVEVDFSRSLTSLAYHLNIEYPTLMRLIKMNNDWKPLPEYIVENMKELKKKIYESSKQYENTTKTDLFS